jgi:predicted secreted protein
MPANLRLATSALLLAGLVGPAGAGPAAADDEETNRVSFHVERSREVANDWLQATVGVTAENPDPAKLADEINKTMAWALQTAGGNERVHVESGGYRTYPIDEKGRVRRWRGSQDLRIESADFDAATTLLGALQARLQLQSLNFTVSPERQREVEDQLIAEALDAFRSRAEMIKRKLGADSYQIVRLDLNTQAAVPRPLLHEAAMMRAANVTPPAVEGGRSRVTVGVAAVIELD